nr:MFS transporter [Lentilactobacillus otakiensis]
MSSYILYFYTDVFDIPVSAAGMIILIACIVDAVSAIFFGDQSLTTHILNGGRVGHISYGLLSLLL